MDCLRDFDAFESHTNSVWSNMILGEFYKQNRIVKEHLKCLLDTPNFLINNDHHEWGRWTPESRTISLSSELFRNYHWDAVVHTLKHEMAHMIVSEIFKGDYSAHGEAFKKACDVMGIDANTTSSSQFKESYSLPEKEKIVDRIYKLFALGESSFEHESKVAIAKAYELMMKYNISSIQPNDKKVFISRPVGLKWGKIPAYIKKLARVIADYYFVKHIYIYGSSYRHIEFFGEPHNLDIAEYVFHYLINEGDQKWKEFQQTEEYQKRRETIDPDDDYWSYHGRKRKPAVYSKIAFLLGLYSGFAETLETQDTVVQGNLGDTSKALVQQNDEMLEDHYQKKYNPRSWGRSRVGRGGGYDTGVRAGRGIKIRSGVVRSSNGRTLQLSA